MMHIDEQTLDDLEFNTIRNWLENFAVGETAGEQLRCLSPVKNRILLHEELQKVNELKSIRSEESGFPRLEFEEIKDEIKYLPIKNASISLEGFMRLRRASTLVNQLLYFFDKREKEYPQLSRLLEEGYYTSEIVEAIEAVFDKYGKIKDDASEALSTIRSSIKQLREKINRNFDRELKKLLKENVLGDTRETFISDRRVLTVLSNFKRKIPGSVHGSSKTGNLTYIEPEINIPLNNELELLLDDERKEIFRILQELKKRLFFHYALIKAYQSILTAFDFVNAKCRLALELNGHLPSFMEEREMELIDAFHPILWKNNMSQGKKTQSQHIKMDKYARMLVISGPNAGGKSITLKSIGLLQIMFQCGLLVPVHPNSKMCFFENILSDIGDNQSIANELSTYSYRLKRMNQFLQIANKNTLLLLDEFGTGSDPDLGGALAEVIFEELYNKKSFAVITTHYNNIKLKADRLKNAVNGSMLFNTETLAPTYLFSTGQPGSSFTFEVAKINGIPDQLIAEAKKRLDKKKVELDRLLSELQKEKNYLSRLNKEHIEAQDFAREALEEFTRKREEFERKLKQLRENAEQNQRLVTVGTKMSQFIERFNSKSRKKNANDALLEDIRKYLAIEKAKIDGLKLKQEALKKPSNSKKQPSKRPLKKSDEYQRHKIQLGSKVKLIATKQVGTVEDISENNVTVSFGFARMKVDKDKLMWISD